MILTKVSLCELTAEERRTLEQFIHSRTAQARLGERAQILLATAEGHRPAPSPAGRSLPGRVQGAAVRPVHRRVPRSPRRGRGDGRPGRSQDRGSGKNSTRIAQSFVPEAIADYASPEPVAAKF
jgi:hypothetical protein